MDFVKQISLQEKGDAEVFAHLFKDKVIYDHDEDAWYIFNGHIWEFDKCKKTLNLVESVAKIYEQATSQINYEYAAKLERFHKARISSLRKKSGIKNVLELAEAKLPLTEEWDSDPYLLAVKNGIIDLKTGKLRAGKPDDYMRNCSQTEFKELDEPCEQWMQFLNELFPNNPEIPEFLQRLFGYAISGLSVEHVFVTFYGRRGRNGKDVMLETLCNVLGNALASPISKEVLLSGLKNPGASAPFLFELQGKRLVYSDETSEGAAFDSAQVKMLSGGAPFVAKKLYMQPTIIHPQYLIVITSNSKPAIDADDDALWERLICVEYTQRFVDDPSYDNEHLVDKFLKDKLKDEYPGILAWLVKGCLEWQEKGLMIPDSVKYTTDAYRTEQDSLGRFIDAECIITQDAKVNVTQLYDIYTKWAEVDGVKKLSRREFSRKMEERFPKERYATGYHYEGIELKPDINQETEAYLEMAKSK